MKVFTQQKYTDFKPFYKSYTTNITSWLQSSDKAMVSVRAQVEFASSV